MFSCSILRKKIPIAKKLLKALKIKDAVVTADVVYFSVYHTDYGDFVDGGLVVNHPGFFVILEAKRFLGIENADISMLYIGYFSTSVTDIKYFADGVRSHWSSQIENNLHWCLNVLFSDDECTVIERNAARNLAIIRRSIYKA